MRTSPTTGYYVDVFRSKSTVTNRTATWSYEFDNAAVYGAGTYAGQVVYTATMP